MSILRYLHITTCTRATQSNSTHVQELLRLIYNHTCTQDKTIASFPGFAFFKFAEKSAGKFGRSEKRAEEKQSLQTSFQHR